MTAGKMPRNGLAMRFLRVCDGDDGDDGHPGGYGIQIVGAASLPLTREVAAVRLAEGEIT